MPIRPATIIQKVAPGPPTLTAIATPAMLPRPTVAERAAVRAWKWLTSPLSSGLEYLPRVTSMACLKPRTLMKPMRRVKNTAPSTNHTTASFRSMPLSTVSFPSASTTVSLSKNHRSKKMKSEKRRLTCSPQKVSKGARVSLIVSRRPPPDSDSCTAVAAGSGPTGAAWAGKAKANRAIRDRRADRWRVGEGMGWAPNRGIRAPNGGEIVPRRLQACKSEPATGQTWSSSTNTLAGGP